MRTQPPPLPACRGSPPAAFRRLAVLLLAALLAAPRAAGVTYYVNDSSTSGDIWCSAPGSDANGGLTASSPKASVDALLRTYRLNPNDAVNVDTGTYFLTNSIVLTNGGSSASSRVTIRGVPGGATVLNRNSDGPGTRCIDVRASYVTVENLACRGADVGLFVDSAKCRDAILIGNVCYSNGGPGLQVQQSTNNNGYFRIVRNLLYGNGAGLALEIEGVGSGDAFFVTNNTVAQSVGFCLGIGGKAQNSCVFNNILDSSGGGQCLWAYVTGLSSLFLSDYNDLYAHDGSAVAGVSTGGSNLTLSTLADWQRVSVPRNAGGLDQYSFTRVPCFASPPAGDYHLRSTTGRWQPSGVGTQGTWVADSDASPCLDVGLASTPYALEPQPNGGRVNLGSDGGTAAASKTGYDRRLLVFAPDSGQLTGQPQPIRWIASGLAWYTNSDSVRLDYSLDGGVTWSNIVPNIQVNQGSHSWTRPGDTFAGPSGCTVRVAYVPDPGVNGTAFLPSLAGNGGGGGACTYYVNDGSTNGDLWCSQPGSDANDGLSPSQPLASLQTLLSRYVLASGDCVQVDAGTYLLPGDVVVDANHSGAGGAAIRIVGANRATVLDRQSQAPGTRCLDIRATNVTVQGFTCLGAEVGIQVDGAAHRVDLLENTSCSNAAAGLRVQAGETATGGWFVVSGNLLFANGSGMDLESEAAGAGDGFAVSNNTVVVSGGAAVAVGGAPGASLVYHNIGVATGGGYCFAIDGRVLAGADYNCWYATGGGAVGAILSGPVTSTVLTTLGAWQRVTTGSTYGSPDRHSFSRDPAFADPARDFHVRSAGGRWLAMAGGTSGTWIADATTSPCVDAGYPSAPVGAEPTPNGGRLNVGVYGGTAQASKTPAGRRLLALVPDEGFSPSCQQPVYWNAVGQGWQQNDAVRIEYSLDGGVSWTALTDTASASSGSFTWSRSPASYNSLEGCRVRVTAVADGSVSDTVTLEPAMRLYYVNDGSTAGDQWCTQVGSDVQDGLTPATPVASLQTILDRNTLGPCDVVFVDAGTYALTGNVVVASRHVGQSDRPFVLRGANRATVLDRQSHAQGACAIEVYGRYAVVEGFTLANADVGLFFGANPFQSAVVSNNAFRGHSRYGVRIDLGSGAYGSVKVANNLFYASGGGVQLGGSGFYSNCDLQLVNNTIAVAQGAAVNLADTAFGATVRNNVFDVSGSACALDYKGSSLGQSDYNDYFLHDGGALARFRSFGTTLIAYYGTLAEWRAARAGSGWDANSLSLDPSFAAPSAGDYHLKSKGGRWQPAASGNGGGGWVTDTVHSAVIDMGDPGLPVGGEPSPNGGRRNLGAYGGTAEASKSAPQRTLLLAGETAQPAPLQIALAWTPGGQGWGTSDTVRLEYSADGGQRWSPIPNAAALPYGLGEFTWTVATQSTASASSYLRARVVCNQDATVRYTIVLGTKAPTASRAYYVNDASSAGDVYCTAPGSPANSGTSPSAPADSLGRIFNAYRLGPGDTVYVDTGRYTGTNAAVLSSSSAGTPDRRIQIVGSTNGAVLDVSGAPGDRPACLELHGDAVRVERLVCVGGKVGIAVNAASCRTAQLVANVCISNLLWGIEVRPWTAGGGSEYVLLQNVAWANGGGMFLQGDSSASASRATFVAENNSLVNNGHGIVCCNAGAAGWRPASLKNNAIRASGAGRACVLATSGSLTYSDFNNFDTTNGAAVVTAVDPSGTTNDFPTLSAWHATSGLDGHSLSADSRFAAADSGDLRLGAGSPCQDAGVISFWMHDALDAGGNPRVFGDTVDIGAYETSRKVSLRVFLQGAYRIPAHAMSTELHSAGLLPLTAPYAADPRTVSAVASGAVDWVLVQFREGLDGSPVFSRSAFLRADGMVVADDGTPSLPVNLPSGTSYHVAVRHRNHLPALSATAVVFTNGSLAYDFTVSAARYAGGTQVAVEPESGVWASAAGDADGDGAVLPADLAVGASQVNLYGCHRGDANLDGWVDVAVDGALATANLGRAAVIPRPETTLLPMMRVSPPQVTLLSGATNAFTAVPQISSNRAANVTGGGGSLVSAWTFVTNASGAALDVLNSSNALYTAGAVTGRVDTLEAWEPLSDALGRALASVIGTQDVALAGQAVLVAGRKSASDPLWPTTDYLTDYAYETLLYRGFSKENIHYLNPEPDQDVDGNGQLDDIDDATTYANVSLTISNACATADRVFIYLADHGGDSSGNGFFRLNPDETLSAADLRVWLDGLQNAYGTEVTILLDFCYAGSVLDELSYTGAARRIVIASCSSNQPSYFVAGGLVSFSQAFFSGVLLGEDVKECFDLAQSCMAIYQSGQLDDDKNGAYSNGVDGASSTGYYIGPTGAAPGDQPAIGEVCGNQVLTEETSATLWVAGIASLNPLDRVWCVIVPPGFDPSPENPVTDLPEIDLAYDSGSGRYTVTADNFTAPGTYLAMFYARDVLGRVSAPRQCYVAQTGYDDRLILAACGSTNDPAWSAVHYLSRLARTTFRIRLFDDAHTRYFSPVAPQDLDSDGLDDVAGAPSLAALNNAILDWAVTNSTDRLTIYLIGPAESNALRVCEGESLDAATLASWLDAFQTTNAVSVNVILDFAGAGAFIPVLATTNPATGEAFDRIVVAAAQSGRDALHENAGTVSFSQYFLAGVLAGETFGDAFTDARRTIRRVSGSVRQRAEIDDNGDGTANEKNVDGNVADTVYLGSAFLTGEDSPVIGGVIPVTLLDGETTVTLWATNVAGVAGISNVWCVVTPPDYDGTSPLGQVDLPWSEVRHRYEAVCAGLTNPGSYALTFYAVDNAGHQADPVQSELIRADIYEPDDSSGQASEYYGEPQIHTFHSSGDVDWAYFYAVTNFPYEIETYHFSTNLDTVLDVYRELPDGSLELIDHVDEEGIDMGEYTGLDFPPEGRYFLRVSQYGESSAWSPSSYELSVSIPAGFGVTLIVVGINYASNGALPTNAYATVSGLGGGTKYFNGSTSVTFDNLFPGTHSVQVPAPTNFFPREDPNTPNQVPNPNNAYFGNPRNVTILSGWGTATFWHIPFLSVTQGVVRDAWTHGFLTNAVVAFQSTSGYLTGTLANAHIILTTYGVPWRSVLGGLFPSNVILAECNWDLKLSCTGYVNYVLAAAISNVARGSTIQLGTHYIVPADTNANGIGDSWEGQYFPLGGCVATNDTDGDGVSNLGEYYCGTDPTNAASVLTADGIEGPVAGGFTLEWPVVAGRTYLVEARTSLLAGAWASVAGPWEATNGQTRMEWTDTGVSSRPRRFYRVGLDAP